jgi:hypothetical protein
MKEAFPYPLQLIDAGMKGDSRQWRLATKFRYVGSKIIDVPVGFITDGASVPRVFWSLFSPTGSYLKAAVIHDYLYVNQLFSRETTDLIFLEAMKESGVGFFTRLAVYRAVKFGGWVAWKKNKQK